MAIYSLQFAVPFSEDLRSYILGLTKKGVHPIPMDIQWTIIIPGKSSYFTDLKIRPDWKIIPINHHLW